MITFKCKMCGGDLTFEPGASVAECPYCGTNQTLPKLDDDKRANLYDRANHFRRQNEFDKAMAIYEQILAEDRTDAEAYWSLVLCRYGIEYVEDPASHKRVPTVNRVQYASILADEDYKSALSHADAAQWRVYEAEANAIAEIQKGILDISRKEAPFDVFICYKETDANGRRTPDSVLANDMYHQLTKEGFKVFFSRITLEDKIGTAYEPYIFAALNSAKVMVVLGTKPEYFNAVWVKNEWSRYLALIRGGADKTLVPAYRDMDPYDLPEEFAHLQAQDMGKLGFMQDLIRGIKKILHKDEPKPQTVAQPTAAAPANNVAPLLKRAFMFLEDGDFTRADDFCEQVLNLDPENGRAYLGKLMIDLQVRRENDLKNQPQPFDKSSNYQKIIRFGDEALKKQVRSYVEFIMDRNEHERQKGIYALACDALKKALTVEECIAAKQQFESILDFEDSTKKVGDCEEKKESIIDMQYHKAARCQKRGKWQEAIVYYNSIEEYRDCSQKIKECIECIHSDDYMRAEGLAHEGKWDEAIRAFDRLTDYRDSRLQAQRCRDAKKAEQEAEEQRREQERLEAEAKAEAEEQRRKQERQVAKAKITKAVTIVAIVITLVVGVSMLYVKVIRPNSIYSAGLKAMRNGNYDKAIALFNSLGNFKDSTMQITESKYQNAEELRKNNRYDEAYDIYSDILGYKDVDDILANNADILAAAWRAQFSAGKTVLLGKYRLYPLRQKDESKSNEWIVLSCDGEKATLITKYAINDVPYNSNTDDINWEISWIREWLNNSFYEDSFDKDEKQRLETVAVSVEEYTANGLQLTKSVRDKVYLLSGQEAVELFPTNESRIAFGDLYSQKGTWWWLRTPGIDKGSIVSVWEDGSLLLDGLSCDITAGAARPVIVFNIGEPLPKWINGEYGSVEENQVPQGGAEETAEGAVEERAEETAEDAVEDRAEEAVERADETASM